MDTSFPISEQDFEKPETYERLRDSDVRKVCKTCGAPVRIDRSNDRIIGAECTENAKHLVVHVHVRHDDG